MMNKGPQSIEELAQLLIAFEASQGNPTDPHKDGVVRVCEKLSVPLSRLAGLAGFVSLLTRALALTRGQVPAMQAVKVEADGRLQGFDLVKQDPEARAKGGLILVTQVLGLLVTFIGEPLTLRLVRDAWPEVPTIDKEGKA